ncbi:MAG: rane-bound transcriptional regulator, ribonuclease BN-related protein [Fibrobacteres bacterium]|nr:rane-bound transcriptional regulator, ribonuclease BN-related protein [Fibrobacterota bacterium]
MNLLLRALIAKGLSALSILHRVGMAKDIRWTRQFAARLVRVLVLAGMSFPVNQIPVRASALTYTSILSFVPFAVILSSVAGRFGYLDLLSRLVIYMADSMNLDLNLDPVLGVIEYAQRVDFQKLGLVGSLGLLFAFFLSMNNIELAFDHIWDIRKDRNWWRAIKDYTPFLVMLILLLLAAGNILLRYRAFLDTKFSGVRIHGLVQETVVVLSTVAVFGFLWLALGLLFYIIPNTRVRLFPALLASTICTGSIYLLSRVVLLAPGLILSRNNFIYGSLAIFPAVLLMIYLFWVIILYGAAVAFMYQRLYHSREKTSEVPGDSEEFRRMEKDVLDVLKAIYALSGSKTMHGRRVVPLAVLSGELWDDSASVQRLAAPLVDLGILAKRTIKTGPVYAPRKPLEEVDLNGIHHLLLRLDPKGTGNLRSLNSWDEIKHTLGILYSSGKQHPPLYLGTVLSDWEGQKA